MKQTFSTLFFSLVLLACSSQEKKHEPAMDNPDSVEVHDTISQKIDTVKKELVEPVLLTHEEHEEDSQYPWWDTSLGGVWVKESFKDSLINIFKDDTTRSIYEYSSKIIGCDKELIKIEFEGCAKENKFYIRNIGCNNKYIASSSFGINEKGSFELQDVYTNQKYFCESPEYSKLFIDNNKYIKHFYMEDITEALDGVYIVYDNKNVIIDTVHYRNDSFSKSDTLAEMRLLDIFHTVSYSDEKPLLDHSDLVSIGFLTGNMITADVPGGTEERPELMRVRFDLLRTSNGFELHNAYKRSERRYLVNGLVYKFELIAVFHYR